MLKIKQCDSCKFYSNNPNLVCAVNPGGVDTDTCIDYRLSPDYIFLQQWNADNYVYYDNELITVPEDKPITKGQEPCAIMGDEVITMNECHDITVL